MRIESTHCAPQSLRHLIFGLHPLVNWLKEQQIDPRPFLEKAGIPLRALAEADYSLSPGQEIGFSQEVYRELERPELGLLIGPRFHLSSYGMLGLAAMTSPDLWHCFKVFLDNIILTWTYFKVSVYIEGETAYVQMDTMRDLGGASLFMIERDLSATHCIGSEALEVALPLTSVEFQHPPTSYPEIYRSVFGVDAQFDASANRIGFAASWLERPLAKSQPETARIFASQCEDIAQRLQTQSSFAEKIRNLLLDSTAEQPSLASLARRLNTTARTIQRRLLAEGTSYQALLEDVRLSVAVQYLTTTGLTIETIAAHLGYSDSAAFSNAFKRWTRESPTAFRRRQLQT
ncbi:MAG: AraC family transcriptional regulator [Halioglobus sp.]|nr:AraC family transcriptional regulator [Halioglobus sp.]